MLFYNFYGYEEFKARSTFAAKTNKRQIIVR